MIVTDNLFGDILTDLGAAIAGGLGTAASANLNPARPLLVRTRTGRRPTSPAPAGPTRSRPSSASLLLDHLGERGRGRGRGGRRSGPAGAAGYSTQALGDRIATAVAGGGSHRLGGRRCRSHQAARSGWTGSTTGTTPGCTSSPRPSTTAGGVRGHPRLRHRRRPGRVPAHRPHEAALPERQDLPHGAAGLLEGAVKVTKDLVAMNNLPACYIRPLVFLGYGEIGLNPLTRRSAWSSPAGRGAPTWARSRSRRGAGQGQLLAAPRPQHHPARGQGRPASTSTPRWPRPRRSRPATTRASCSTPTGT